PARAGHEAVAGRSGQGPDRRRADDHHPRRAALGGSMETVLRGAAVYAILLLIIRFSGRRTLAQMTAFDLVLILIVAETTQQALLGDDFSITNAVVLILTLFTIDIGLSYVKETWPAAEKALDGRPTV